MSAAQATPACVDRVSAVATLRDLMASVSPEVWQAGVSWYAAGQRLVCELAAESGRSPEVCAIIVAHLSSNTPWQRNAVLARAYVADPDQVGPGRTFGTLGGNVTRCHAAWRGADPWDSFGRPTANLKTRAFAANLAGDENAVAIDRWAIRALGLPEAIKDRVGVNACLQAIYREVAAEYGITPAQCQAIAWCAVRGSGE